MAVHSSMSKWRSVTTGVPWQSLSGLVLFSIFINHIDSGTECTLTKFAHDTKLSGAADALDGRQTIQRDLHRLEEEDNINFKKLNKAKSCAWVGQSSISIQTEW